MKLDFEKLKERTKNKTLLGVGPVTRNTVDAVINIANLNAIPMQLIPSRRQIECKEFGGGYVWNTQDFAKYVNDKDKNNCIILARDHGGPYQGIAEENLDETTALEKSLDSYGVDIDSDFNILHLDPSVKPKSFIDTFTQLHVLLDGCNHYAKKINKEIFFEVGTDGHGTKPSDLAEMKKLLDLIKAPTMEKASQNVKFLVANTGTCVKERCNVGRLHVNETLAFIDLCEQYGLFLKEHNNDYNTVKTLTMHSKLGVHSSNIAPEYGVEETKELLRLLKAYDLHEEHEDFIELAYQSKKWEKWMINGEHPDKEYLATICGHYIMEKPEVKEIKFKLDEYTTYPVNQLLTMRVERVIYSHLKAFGWF